MCHFLSLLGGLLSAHAVAVPGQLSTALKRHCFSYLSPGTLNWRAASLHPDDPSFVETIWKDVLPFVPHGPIKTLPSLRLCGY